MQALPHVSKHTQIKIIPNLRNCKLGINIIEALLSYLRRPNFSIKAL